MAENYHNLLVEVIKLNVPSTKTSKLRTEKMLKVKIKAQMLLSQGNTAGGWNILHKGRECEFFLLKHLPGAKYNEATQTVYK